MNFFDFDITPDVLLLIGLTLILYCGMVSRLSYDIYERMIDNKIEQSKNALLAKNNLVSGDMSNVQSGYYLTNMKFRDYFDFLV